MHTYTPCPGIMTVYIITPTIVALLLIIIIILMVVSFVRKNRRKSGWGVPNNVTYPNPMYYNNQGR